MTGLMSFSYSKGLKVGGSESSKLVKAEELVVSEVIGELAKTASLRRQVRNEVY